MNIDFKNVLQMSLANSAAVLRVMIELNLNLRFLDVKINIKFKNILQMSFANSAAALRGISNKYLLQKYFADVFCQFCRRPSRNDRSWGFEREAADWGVLNMRTHQVISSIFSIFSLLSILSSGLVIISSQLHNALTVALFCSSTNCDNRSCCFQFCPTHLLPFSFPIRNNTYNLHF